MLGAWREEQASLSARSASARGSSAGSAASARISVDGGDGPARLAARLSLAHNKQAQAAALADARGKQVRQLHQAQQTAALQLEALRDSREGLSRVVSELELKLRAEQQRADKLKRQLEKASERARVAAEAEVAAREEAAGARAEVENVREQLGIVETQLRLAKAHAHTMEKERDAARREAATRAAERDTTAGALAGTRTTIAEMDDRREGVQRQLESAKMSLIESREARRAKESERLAAVAAAETATKKLEAAMRQLDREKGVTGDTVARGLLAEQLLSDAEAKSVKLELEVNELRAAQSTMLSDQQAGAKRLEELRNAVGEAAAAILIDGDLSDPLRVHNESVLVRLFEALAVSGGEVSKFGWAASRSMSREISRESSRPSTPAAAPPSRRSGHSSHTMTRGSSPLVPHGSSAGDSEVAAARGGIVPPLASVSPKRLAALQQVQRDSGQMLLDSMSSLKEVSSRQRHKLQQRLLELCAKLQYRGDSSEARAEIAAEMRRLASNDSPVLQLPASLDAAPPLVLAEDTHGEWPPQTRPSAPSPPLPHSQRPTLSSSRVEARSPTRGESPQQPRSPPRGPQHGTQPPGSEVEWHWQRQSAAS